jgi:hypothetical protein
VTNPQQKPLRGKPSSVGKGVFMSDRVALEKLDIDLTRSREEAASLGDHLLTYVISMAILQVRKK